jgi:hypothetical protein
MIKATRRHSRFAVDPLPHQWDLNQELRICGLDLDTAPEVHFANAVTDPAPVVQSTLEEDGAVCVTVPNFLLQQAYTITAYVYVTERGTERTQHKIAIPVLPRPRPADYVYTETEVKRYEDLGERIEELEQEAVALGHSVAALEQGVGAVQFFGNDAHARGFIRLNDLVDVPVTGKIEDNVVLLTADLPKGVYEFKIVRADGATADLCTYEVV